MTLNACREVRGKLKENFKEQVGGTKLELKIGLEECFVEKK